MNYETVIGIEMHCELKTKTKMFSGAPAQFNEDPNTSVNEIDLAHPGTLPCLNKKAVELAVRACLGTHCAIDSLVRFDRKNYYYPDLTKGYQITQQFHPLGRAGYVEIDTPQGKKKIRLNRIHMEEDTARQFHQGDTTYLDFNRSGVPLIEIVTEADMRTGQEAADYVAKLRNILRYLGVSDGKMEEGSMRCDTNVSIRPAGSKALGTKTEIKNLNSIANIQKAIDYEARRQAEVLEAGGRVEQATFRFDEAGQKTVMMRRKEGDVDYKFFPEPNIFPVRLSEEWLQSIRESLPELPGQRAQRYREQYGLKDYDISVLIDNKELSDFYDEVMRHTDQAEMAANYILSDMSGWLNQKGVSLEKSSVTPQNLAALVHLVSSGKISSKQAKDLFPLVMEGKDPKEQVKKLGLSQITDPQEIRRIVIQVLDANAQSVADYKGGKDRALGYLVGQVMKMSRGKANPQTAHDLVVEEIDKR